MAKRTRPAKQAAPLAPEIDPAQAFLAEYRALCEKYGLVIVPEMGFKAQLDGTYTVQVQQIVARKSA